LNALDQENGWVRQGKPWSADHGDSRAQAERVVTHIRVVPDVLSASVLLRPATGDRRPATGDRRPATGDHNTSVRRIVSERRATYHVAI
jgi:hypothetical protein